MPRKPKPKPNWNAWIADIRAYFDYPDSAEMHSHALLALMDAEEFLAKEAGEG